MQKVLSWNHLGLSNGCGLRGYVNYERISIEEKKNNQQLLFCCYLGILASMDD